MGRTRWWGGLVWALVIKVGMMATPPMVVAMDTGYFGFKLGQGLLNGVFLGSLSPHVAYGVALGLLLERYVRHDWTIFELLRRPSPPSTREGGRRALPSGRGADDCRSAPGRR